MYSDDFKIDSQKILQRKEYYKKRVNAISAFVDNKKECRSKIIAAYFGDDNVPECKICDNCINNKEMQLSSALFKTLSEKILPVIKKQPIHINSLIQLLQPEKEKDIWKVIDYFISENIIETDSEKTIRYIENTASRKV
jgi:ATP-dependent DNA helicase RecQ